ncbi:Arc family DNA-binding protein [Devosia sp. ZB163]|uniref:Arc family DNA-binding protein n=1 Tax=Devosia sp. ZB163 TaxID=3025938 RepID=UPI0023612931|nr:Arc family DNA-binding protein [Devosia sp. ZB163]MDC9822970.1 Arc family DNA-binding protein [Devosia sp. ZB163]
MELPQDSESRSLDKVIVRLPDGMRDRLKSEADRNKRSMNAEIVARLETSFDLPGVPGKLDTLGEITRSRTSDLYRFLSESIERSHADLQAQLDEIRRLLARKYDPTLDEVQDVADKVRQMAGEIGTSPAKRPTKVPTK